MSLVWSNEQPQFFKGGFTFIEKNNFFEKENYKEARLPFLS